MTTRPLAFAALLGAVLALATPQATPQQAPATLAGRWEGTLDAGVPKLRLVLDIVARDAGGHQGTLLHQNGLALRGARVGGAR
ncbi:MAG TPA: hypothetical protein VIN61_09480 [Gammaproteobacteria bacterium]